MESTKDFNRKQYQIMLNLLNDYENGNIVLDNLNGSLGFLLGCLQDIEEKWEAEFSMERGQLDTIYSVAFVENRPLSTSDQEEIAKSVKNLKKLLENSLKEYKKKPDPFISKSALIIDNEWLMCPNCTDFWKCSTNDAMVICPSCNEASHNPRYQK